MIRYATALALLAVALAGCSTTSTSGGSDTLAVADQVSSGFADQRNVIVRDTACSEDGDQDHFSCDVTYETPEGATGTANVRVTCDPDRCVWREQ